MRISWITDIHLNFLGKAQIRAFCSTIARQRPDAVIISGDISEAPELSGHLRMMEHELAVPIYFVLGNHDFYRGSIRRVREEMAALSASSRYLRWLPRCGVVGLTERTALVGHDGWGDGRLGEGRRSRVLLNDAVLIEDLRESQDLFAELHALGDEAAAHFEEHLPAALARSERVIVAIHAPPFREACWHEGRISDDDWLPHFTCHAAGQVLERTMRAHRDKQMTVVCGHTHSGGHARILSNLEVRTGAADYERPEVQTTLVIE